MIPWVFLTVTLIGALFTLNAYLPQRRTGPLIIPSFFGGWLTSELPLHHVAWQALATLLFVLAGALDAWPGTLGLGITLVSWAGLVALIPAARHADAITEASLKAALGDRYQDEIEPSAASHIHGLPGSPRLALNPFDFKHPHVEVIRDVPYVEGGGPRNRLDIYKPRTPVENAPVLLQIHGGGWVIGNKREQALPLMNHMAARGWICVTANSRLSPSATFPDHLIDLKRAIRWIREEISAYGGDPNFICATGGSAGGHLSSLVGLTANDPEYQPGFEEVDTSMRAVVPFYGVYDFLNHHRLQAMRGMDLFIGRMVMKKSPAEDPEAFRRASPMHRMHPDAPPFYIIHGSHDSLASVEEARHFAFSLGQISKSPVAYAEISGAQHAFEIFHSIRTGIVIESVERFLGWVHSQETKKEA
jgi:acetyl esterase/lipase